MCGIAGFSLGRNEYKGDNAKRDELSQLLSLTLLQGIEHRGHDATGMAWYGDEKQAPVWVKKLGVTAKLFLAEWNWMGVNSDTAILHTRAGTGGNSDDNVNNHPIVVPGCALIHNGILYNENELFKKYGYQRQGVVDSEILPWMIADKGIKSVVEEVEGDAAIAWLTPADKKHTLRMANLGQRPLEIAYTTAGSVIFASEWNVITAAVKFVNEHTDQTIEIASKACDTDGRMYTVRGGRVIEQKYVGKVTNNRKTYGTGYQHSPYIGGRSQVQQQAWKKDESKVEFRCQNYPKSLRPHTFRPGGKCPTCELYGQFCICRYNQAPLPPYPSVKDDWIPLAGVKPTNALTTTWANGDEAYRPDCWGQYPKWRVLGEHLVSPADFLKWENQIKDLDEKAREDELIEWGTTNGDDMVEWKPKDVKFGHITRFSIPRNAEQPWNMDGTEFFWIKGEKTGVESLNREQCLAILKVRWWRETDGHDVYLVRTLADVRGWAFGMADDWVMVNDKKTAYIWEIGDDGMAKQIGTWDAFFGTPKSQGVERVITPSEVLDPPDGFEMIDQALDRMREANVLQDLIDEQEFEEKINEAFGITNFDMSDEICHAFLVKREEKKGHRVEYLVHWRSRQRVTLLCDDGIRLHYDMDGTLKHLEDGHNMELDNGAYVLHAVGSGRAVAEEIVASGEANLAWYMGVDVLENFELEREIPLRPFSEGDDVTTTEEETTNA